MTQQAKCLRGLVENSSCKLCMNVEDSGVHALRDCALSREVWMGLLSPSQQATFFNGDFDGWLRYNIKLGKKDPDWSLLFGEAIAGVWRWRNKILHGEVAESAARLIRNIKSRIMEVSTWKSHGLHMGGKAVEWLCWAPPPVGVVKLNVDAAVKGQQGGAGGILRDFAGTVLGGFQARLGCISALEGELAAIKIGLHMAWDRGFKKIVVESDCLEGLNIIGEAQSGDLLFPVVAEIRDLLKKDWHCSLIHIWREANQVADTLASHSVSLASSGWVFSIPPHFLAKALADDQDGRCVPRLVSSYSNR